MKFSFRFDCWIFCLTWWIRRRSWSRCCWNSSVIFWKFASIWWIVESATFDERETSSSIASWKEKWSFSSMKDNNFLSQTCSLLQRSNSCFSLATIVSTRRQNRVSADARRCHFSLQKIRSFFYFLDISKEKDFWKCFSSRQTLEGTEQETIDVILNLFINDRPRKNRFFPFFDDFSLF